MALDATSLPYIFEIIANAANTYVGSFIPLASKLLGIGVLVTGTWLVLKEAISSSPRNAFAGLLLLIMQAAIAFAVITNWESLAGIVWALQVDIAKPLGGSGDVIAAAINPINQAMHPVLEYLYGIKPPPPDADLSLWGKMAFYLEETFKALFFVPAQMFFAIIVLFMMGLTVALIAGSIMMAEVSIVIGMALGPLMIALNFIPFLNFTLDGIVRFFLGAVMLKTVAMLTGLLLGGAMQAVFSTGITAGGDATQGAKLLALIFLVFIAGAFLYVAIKIDDIARALVSGGVVGGPGARVVSQGAVQGAGRSMGAAGGAMSGVAHGAGAAAAGARGAMASMRGGASAGAGFRSGVGAYNKANPRGGGLANRRR